MACRNSGWTIYEKDCFLAVEAKSVLTSTRTGPATGSSPTLNHRGRRSMPIRMPKRQGPMPCSDELDLYVTISLGVASMRAGDSLVSLIARSDAALYEAKNAGRDRIVFSA